MNNSRKSYAGMWLIASILCSAGGAVLWAWERQNIQENYFAAFGILLAAVGILCMVLAWVRFSKLIKILNRENHQLQAKYNEASDRIVKMEEQAQQEAEELRSTLAHGLRMPLSIIQGYADLLSGNMVQDEGTRTEYLEKIAQRCQYMTEILSRQFSFQDAVRKRKLHYEQFDLLQLINQAVDDMKATAEDHGIGIRVIAQEQALPVELDSYLIHQILFNLMENAIKYMGRPGSITLLALKEGENVLLRAKDDGIGLSSEETEHIFELHFQGGNKTRGKGHGLYLVRQIVEAHGGTISAESSVGQGMGISITLPQHPSV